MLTEISMALSSLKATSDIIKGLTATATETKLNEVRITLQGNLLEAQQALIDVQASGAATAARIRQLEQELIDLQDWSVEKARYELRDAGRGAFVYMPNAEVGNDEPPHWLCPNCFGLRRKSFMQFKGQDKRPGGGNGDTSNYACDTCRSSIKVTYTVKPTNMPMRSAS